MRGIALVLSILTSALLFGACSHTEQSVEVHDQPATGWDRVEEFTFMNDDTLSMRELAVVVRYNRCEVADSVAINIMTISPDSLLLSEDMILRIPRLGDMRPAEHTFPYRKSVILGKRGEYRFRIAPKESVEGIGSVGLLITNQNEE